MTKLYEEFGDWHFHRFWSQFLTCNPNFDEKAGSTIKLPKEYAGLSSLCVTLLLQSRGIFIVARLLRGETKPLNQAFFARKETEELAELQAELDKYCVVNFDQISISIEQAIIRTNNKILRRCLANFEGDLAPKLRESDSQNNRNS